MNARRSNVFAAIALGMKGRVILNAAKADDAPAEILLTGPVGGSYWSEDGFTAKDVTDALNQVPAGKRIVLGINSPGGSVSEGLAIYNAIKRRSGDITCRVDGYACSIASVFPLGAGKVVSPKSAVWMIHEPWVGTVGDAEEHRRSIAMLEANARVLAAIYAEHTGHTREECRAAMDAETWMTGEEAAEWGLATETNDEAVTLDEIKDSPFSRVPAALAPHFGKPINALAPFAMFRRTTPAPISNSNRTSQQPMNRIAILAALKKHGVNTPDNATDEVILAEVGKLVAAGKITFAEMAAFQAQPAPAPAASVPAPAAAPAPAPAPVAAATDPAVVARLQALEVENNRLRTREVAATVDAAIRERRIPSAARDNWIRRGTGGEDIAAELAQYPAALPGVEPIVEITDEAPENVLAGLQQMRGAVVSFMRGNDVSREQIRDGAAAIGRTIAKNRARLSGVLAATTHTISSDLKRVVILSDLLREFKRRILPLSAFSRVFSGIPLRTEGGTDEFVIPYYSLDAAASTDWNASNGYVYGGTTNAQVKKVAVNKRKYQAMDFGSDLLARQPYFNPSQNLMLKAEKLGVDVFADVLSVVTASNFGTPVKVTGAELFDYDDFVDIRTAANKSDWPMGGRSLLLDSDYEGNLLKDDRVARVDASGSDAALRRGVVGMISGFDTYENPRIPDNSENLKGFASFVSAILVGVAPVDPAPGVRHLLRAYEVVTDPDTGISFSYRYGGNAQMDRDESVIEVAYGYAAGEAKALKRIVSSL